MTGPKASPDGVRVEYRGERLAVLYRFYPLEYMQEQANVPALARATELGELTSVSSFAAIHAQSKLAMARGWLAEPAASSGVFPETYAFRTLDGATLARERRDRVLKRDLSRVGDHVVVGASRPTRRSERRSTPLTRPRRRARRTTSTRASARGRRQVSASIWSISIS